MFRISRGDRGPDPWVHWKSLGFLIGAVVAVLGMALESELLVQIAIGILVLGWFTRFIGGASQEEE